MNKIIYIQLLFPIMKLGNIIYIQLLWRKLSNLKLSALERASRKQFKHEVTLITIDENNKCLCNTIQKSIKRLYKERKKNKI